MPVLRRQSRRGEGHWPKGEKESANIRKPRQKGGLIYACLDAVVKHTIGWVYDAVTTAIRII